VELVVTLVLVGIIGTFTTLFMYTGLNGYLRAKDTTEGALKAQIALDRISLELKDINLISAYNSNVNIDFTSETFPFARGIRYDSGNDEILLSVAGNEYLLVDDVPTFSLTANFRDLNYYSGGDLEVEFIEVSFTVGEVERPFRTRIFPRNMVDDPTS
jgi:hypothetical protein